jgi:hypothetical protein
MNELLFLLFTTEKQAHCLSLNRHVGDGGQVGGAHLNSQGAIEIWM